MFVKILGWAAIGMKRRSTERLFIPIRPPVGAICARLQARVTTRAYQNACKYAPLRPATSPVRRFTKRLYWFATPGEH